MDILKCARTFLEHHGLDNTRLDLLIEEQVDDGGWPTPYDPH